MIEGGDLKICLLAGNNTCWVYHHLIAGGWNYCGSMSLKGATTTKMAHIYFKKKISERDLWSFMSSNKGEKMSAIMMFQGFFFFSFSFLSVVSNSRSNWSHAAGLNMDTFLLMIRSSLFTGTPIEITIDGVKWNDFILFSLSKHYGTLAVSVHW